MQIPAPARAPSLRALFVVSMIDVLGFGVLIPLVPYMAHRFGAGPSVTTAILGSYSLCQLLAAPVWGRLSDRYGRRPILMSSLLGACLSYVILGFADSLWMLLAARMLAGFMAGNLAAAFAYASDVSSPATRAKSMGMVGAAIGIGFMLGMPIGGVLAGNQAQSANFHWPAVASASLSLFALALVKFRLPESRGRQTEAAPTPSLHQGPLALLRQRPGLLLVASAALLVTTAQGILESIFAIWALNRFGAGPRTVGFALFGAALAAVIMQGGLVRVLVPRIGERRLAQAGVLAYIVGLLLVGAGRQQPDGCGIGAAVLRRRHGRLQSQCLGLGVAPVAWRQSRRRDGHLPGRDQPCAGDRSLCRRPCLRLLGRELALHRGRMHHRARGVADLACQTYRLIWVSKIAVAWPTIHTPTTASSLNSSSISTRPGRFTW
jgi:DHA1 family tetracycline resistance protein-like MFS transporter